MLALGAHEVHDYTTGAPLPTGFDVLLNLVALQDPTAAVPLVHSSGTIVSATNLVPVPPSSSIRSVHFVTRNDPAQLAELLALVDAGVVRLDIAARRPMTDLADVHRDAEAGRLRGKTLLLP